MTEILIIEDEPGLAAALSMVAVRLGYAPSTTASATLGLERIAEATPGLVILDIGLPDMNGLEALDAIRSVEPALPVLVITAHGNLQNAVEAKRRGASAYLVKPLDLDALEETIVDLLRIEAGDPEITGERSEAVTTDVPFLVGSSASMQPAFAAIAHACSSDIAVLITGPTGIGKTLAARVIHDQSARSSGPFITVACASLPESLLEAELFGHEKGAFTGALERREGHLERAHGGTLFLDEIGEIPLQVQVKLLRFLDERTLTRLGGRQDLTVDVRVVAATNQNLDEAARRGEFREDLLYRLRVLEVRLPALVERISDLPSLCSHMLTNLARENELTLSSEALEALRGHDWPGNVRELRNVLEHAATVCSGTMILRSHLPEHLRALRASSLSRGASDLGAALREWLDERLAGGADYQALHDELEKRLLAELLPRYEGKPTLLARALGMNRSTLRKKLQDRPTES
ncbi:MAG: sigma-54-dependent Fis family transcriptional regulator [Planctomycetes bacterium]|nr:sigma-54-dependent Fis family transcriptional regulator [Planctomycetota bacterium]MCB9918646.1 sigma-54-dependent Fis family transcriptional regulator [Planctomycetota bacterium]